MVTRLFSGFVFVISSYDAMVIYRVEGVSGLNVFTGIKSKSVAKSQLGAVRPSFLRPVGPSVIGHTEIMLPLDPNGGSRERRRYQRAFSVQ